MPRIIRFELARYWFVRVDRWAAFDVIFRELHVEVVVLLVHPGKRNVSRQNSNGRDPKSRVCIVTANLSLSNPAFPFVRLLYVPAR